MQYINAAFQKYQIVFVPEILMLIIVSCENVSRQSRTITSVLCVNLIGLFVQ